MGIRVSSSISDDDHDDDTFMGRVPSTPNSSLEKRKTTVEQCSPLKPIKSGD